MKKALGVRGSKALVRWLLLDRVQRPVGRVGVHPSAPIEQNTCRKLLKLRQLIVSHIGAIYLLLETGTARAEMGRDLASETDCTRPRLRHSNCTYRI